MKLNLGSLRMLDVLIPKAREAGGLTVAHSASCGFGMVNAS